MPNLTVTPSLLLRLLLPLRHPTQPVQKHGGTNIKHHIHPQQPEIPPPRLEIDAHTTQEVVRPVYTAVLTLFVAARHRVHHLAATHLYKRTKILSAGLIRGRGEREQLVVRTVHGDVAEAGGEQTRGDVGEGVDAVHEDPEAREGVGACEDAAEGVEHDGEDVGEGGGQFVAGDSGDEHVCHRTGEEE